jgi:hypothetical protein
MAQAPDIESELRHMGDGGPRKSSRSLVPQGEGALVVSIMKEAWQEAGHEVDDPGDVDQWYYPDKDVVLIDLNP